MSYIPEVGEKVRITEDNPLYAGLRTGDVVKVTDKNFYYGLRGYPCGQDGRDYKGQLLMVHAEGFATRYYVGVDHVERITPEVETFEEGDYVLYREVNTEDYKAYQVGRACNYDTPCVPLEGFYGEGYNQRRHVSPEQVIKLNPATPVPVKVVEPEAEPETTVFEVGHVYRLEGGILYQHVVAVHKNGNALAWTEWEGMDDGDDSTVINASRRGQYTEIKEG